MELNQDQQDLVDEINIRVEARDHEGVVRLVQQLASVSQPPLNYVKAWFKYHMFKNLSESTYSRYKRRLRGEREEVRSS